MKGRDSEAKACSRKRVRIGGVLPTAGYGSRDRGCGCGTGEAGLES